MNKQKPSWLGIILFLVFSMVITIINITFAQAAKVVDFLTAQQSFIEDHPPSLLAAAAMTNRHDGSDAYVKKDPWITQSYQSGLASFEFGLYSLATVVGDSHEDLLAIYVHSLSITDDQLYRDNQNNIDIRALITFNQPLFSENKTTFLVPFVSLYSETSQLIFLEYTDLSSGLPYPLSIIDIVIQYQILGGGLQSTLHLNETDFSLLEPSQFALSEIYRDVYKISDEIAYNPSLLIAFKAYDIYDVYYLGGELIILLVMGYFLFIYPQIRKRKKSNHLGKKITEEL